MLVLELSSQLFTLLEHAWELLRETTTNLRLASVHTEICIRSLPNANHLPAMFNIFLEFFRIINSRQTDGRSIEWGSFTEDRSLSQTFDFLHSNLVCMVARTSATCTWNAVLPSLQRTWSVDCGKQREVLQSEVECFLCLSTCLSPPTVVHWSWTEASENCCYNNTCIIL